MNENEQNVPLFPVDNKGEPLKTFEVKMQKGSDGTIEKAIFIDGEVVDWAVDISSLMEAYRMGPKYARVAQKDIAKHFVDSVSEVLGRKVTTQDIKKATKTGWI